MGVALDHLHTGQRSGRGGHRHRLDRIDTARIGGGTKPHLRRCVQHRSVHQRWATASTPRPPPDGGPSQYAGDHKRGGQRKPKPRVLAAIWKIHVAKGLPCE